MKRWVISMECVAYDDPRLLSEVWVDAHRKEYYREGCRCAICTTHRALARKRGRCSQFCVVCFDGLSGIRSGKRLTEE